ncbi:glyoxalase family protein [Rhodovulum iodosum]|uniref:Glyoxalase family protein n=1 Tax=Rhodovulum iodosum TaxID=68291 RepID=A0ABV3XUB3_9RHOB|nr:VOC family protein [Rhodovulum robiginosum]RSK30286.1 ring-cleaving dioxygenase [Rhodovulum robiginosum]
MRDQINGLHHVTALASGAVANNAFFTGTLGLRRVKKTVNFDAPDVYHLYYGDAAGTPGTVMTYFPFEGARRGRAGTGEVALTAFAVPVGSLDAWQRRLAAAKVAGLSQETRFGAPRLRFEGPDGEGLALVETEEARVGWTDDGLDARIAIRGFRGVTLRLAEAGPTADLLSLMGYEEAAREGSTTRYVRPGGNGADIVDVDVVAAPPASQGAGSVHHIAFSVPDRAAQQTVREGLIGAGFDVTPPIDRDYFMAIYFRSPGGVLFEVATDDPGFDRDEDPAHLGEALKLPRQHEHLRTRLEKDLVPLEG